MRALGSRGIRRPVSRRCAAIGWAGLGPGDAPEPAAAAHARGRTLAEQPRAKGSNSPRWTPARRTSSADMHVPAARRAKPPGPTPIEHRNGLIKRRADRVGIVPRVAAVVRRVRAILLEQVDASATQR